MSKNIGIVIHTRDGHQTYRVACEEHIPVALRAIFGAEPGGPFSDQEPTGDVIEVNEPCLVCVWLDQHGSDPLAPITIRPKKKIRQNIITKGETP